MGKTGSKFLTFLVVFSMLMSMGVSFADVGTVWTTNESGTVQNGTPIYNLKQDVWVRVSGTEDQTDVQVEVKQAQGNTSLGSGSVDIVYTEGYFSFRLWDVVQFGDSENGVYKVEVGGNSNSDNFKIKSQLITYTVTYDGNGNTGGTEPIDDNNYEEDDEVTVLGQGSLVREGYTFEGWNTKNDGTGTEYEEDDTFDMPAVDVILYAQWDYNGPEDVIVTFDENYTGAPSTYTRTTEENTVLGESMPDDPTRTDYDFLGWNTESDGTGSAFTASTTVTAPITVYAQWDYNGPEDVIVTFDENYTGAPST
ncbi:InlB B-repeat-containing protein, partial [Gudongella sp. DL1XJH-153]|uniref:InlB B-repeat-containing protein n=1 Tax=Gudongella sp. DL1XJH-153 TaxID=3409804 RepID=UPI003BB54894